jgi:multiple epidermal growth factor-like domains protein 10/11
MGKWTIALVLLLAASLTHQALADETVSIIGDELEGPNVCKRLDLYNVTVVVTDMVPYQESKMVWCAQIPPRCRKTEIKLRQVNKTEVFEKSRAIRECCEGYKENEARNKCVPHCPKPCINGYCAAPGQCKCESGYGGPSCDISE